jgi:hypothetical protein
MKNNDDIPTTDTTEIKQLINRVKQGKLDQGDAQLIEKLLNILLTIVSLLERKHTSLRRNDRAKPLRLSEDDPEFWIVWREFSARTRSVF